jgi:hypothetical protein
LGAGARPVHPIRYDESWSALRKLPVDDRLEVLILTAIDMKYVGGVARLNVLRRVSAQQAAASRFKVSEALRDVADELEREVVFAVRSATWN